MTDLIEKILVISKTKEGKTIDQLVLKMTEELGELAEALLSYENAPGCSYKNKDLPQVKEEVSDVVIVAFAIMAKLGMNTAEIKEIIENKLIKWQNVIQK